MRTKMLRIACGENLLFESWFQLCSYVCTEVCYKKMIRNDLNELQSSNFRVHIDIGAERVKYYYHLMKRPFIYDNW